MPATQTRVSIVVPVRTVSEANAHQHWRHRNRRARGQRMVTAALLRHAGPLPPLPVVVTLTRIAPRSLDRADNLPGSMKHVLDGVADVYGVDDRSDLYQWRYAQERGKQKEVGVRVDIEPSENTEGSIE